MHAILMLAVLLGAEIKSKAFPSLTIEIMAEDITRISAPESDSVIRAIKANTEKMSLTNDNESIVYTSSVGDSTVIYIIKRRVSCTF